MDEVLTDVWGPLKIQMEQRREITEQANAAVDYYPHLDSEYVFKLVHLTLSEACKLETVSHCEKVIHRYYATGVVELCPAAPLHSGYCCWRCNQSRSNADLADDMTCQLWRRLARENVAESRRKEALKKVEMPTVDYSEPPRRWWCFY